MNNGQHPDQVDLPDHEDQDIYEDDDAFEDGIEESEEIEYHRSTALLLAGLIAIVVVGYRIYTINSAMTVADAAAVFGALIASGIALPFTICFGIGAVTCLCAWWMNSKVLAIISLVLFTIAMITLPMLYADALPSIVLTILGIVSLVRQGY